MKRSVPRLWRLTSVCLLAGVAGLACDSASPTAPTGTVLSISAGPTQISLDGSSTITVVGRKPNGSALNEGTEVFFSNNIGTLSDVVVPVDEGGVARTTLTGDGRVGTATVEARVGTAGGEGGASASIEVVIGNPQAPEGTSLTLNATPSQIPINGSSTITVIGRRSDGEPLDQGVEILFSTDLGSVNPTVTPVNAEGEAETTLQGDGRVGTATVEASVRTVSGGEGGSDATATIEVRIGSSVSSVSLQATPTSVPEEFDEASRPIDLLALVRDDQGQPLPGVAVNFNSDVGSLDSGGSFKDTNDRGEVRDVLRVAEGDITTVTGDSFTVRAEAASGEGGLQSDEVDISILRKPTARFAFTRNQLTVVFEDQSTDNPTSWFWEFGDGQTSTSQNPVHTYSSAGTFTVTLTATNAAGDGEFSRQVTVDTN